MINNIEEYVKKIAEWCDEYNKEELDKARRKIDELEKENEDLKAPVPSYKTLGQLKCREFCQAIKDDPCDSV